LGDGGSKQGEHNRRPSSRWILVSMVASPHDPQARDAKTRAVGGTTASTARTSYSSSMGAARMASERCCIEAIDRPWSSPGVSREAGSADPCGRPLTRMARPSARRTNV